MKKFVLGLIIVLIILGGLSFVFGSSFNVMKKNSSKLQVVASFYPLYYFSQQIAGDKADVTSITPASAEPHDYEPTTRDIARIETSNLLILNGGALESWGNKIKDDLQGKNIPVVIA